jgi:hypothetical protein
LEFDKFSLPKSLDTHSSVCTLFAEDGKASRHAHLAPCSLPISEFSRIKEKKSAVAAAFVALPAAASAFDAAASKCCGPRRLQGHGRAMGGDVGGLYSALQTTRRTTKLLTTF